MAQRLVLGMLVPIHGIASLRLDRDAEPSEEGAYGHAVTLPPPARDSSFTSYVQGTAFRLGWGDAWASGVGGTGYLTSGPGRPNFVQRFSADVLRYHPKVLVLAGGINDEGRFSPEQIAAAAESLIVRCRCKTVVLSPWSPGPGPTSAEGMALDRYLAAIAQKHQAAYVDVSSWRFPSIDGTHPTQAGHEQIAAHLAPAIRAALGP